MSKIVLIDGHSILHRTFYGIPDLTNPEGIHTNAIYGFLNILFHIISEEQPEYLAVAFDVHAPTFRHEMYSEYKGTRKPMPEELREQVPLMKEVLKAMDIPVLEKAGLEADDILGTIGKRCESQGMEVTIVSGDRDLLQLASDRLLVRIPKTKGGRTEIEDYHTQEVIDHFQVPPERIVDLKALMGDTSDNIPGVPSIGEKTATKLLVQFGDVNNLYAHLEEVTPPRARKALEEHKDLCDLSLSLARICTDGDVSFELSDAKLQNLYTEAAYEWFKRLSFKKFLQNFDVKEQTPDVEAAFRLITDQADVEYFVSKLKREPSAGIFVPDEMPGAALSDGVETVFIPVSDSITADYLKMIISSLIEEMPAVYACSWKEQMHRLQIDSAVDELRILSDEPERFVRDMAVGAYLLNPLKSDYTYDDIAMEHLQITLPDRKELLGKKSPAELMKEDLQTVMRYSCYEAWTAIKAGPVIIKKLEVEDMLDLYENIELPLIPVLYEMEANGIRVRKEELKAYGDNLKTQIDLLEDRIYIQAGEKFNIQSPKQLGTILFEKLGLPAGKKTKSGYSTAADVLEKLAGDYQIVADILEYRTISKLKSTYADGLAEYISDDGRIHGTFNQTITATGRISSTEPNLQNIPVRMELGRQIRKIFVPEDGFLYVDADYSQVELRILAALSGDENLISAYREARDIHRMTASQVFHIPYDEVTDQDRRNAKAVNFGIVYGISSFGLGQDLNISRKEAAEYIDAYFKTYPRVKEYLDETVRFAKENGYVTTVFGRKRPIPELSSGNFMQRSFGERVAMNSPIQGTAADIMKLAMIRTQKAMKEAGLRSRLVLQIHDELLIETTPEEKDRVEKILREAMMHAAELSVPLEVDVKTGSNWMEAH